MQIWGTQPESIDEAEDRDKWMALLKRLDIRQPPGGIATTEEQAIKIAEGLGYPVMVRGILCNYREFWGDLGMASPPPRSRPSRSQRGWATT